MVIYGLVFTIKHFGWPSVRERKNKVLRAIRTGLSSTILVVGVMLLYFYWNSAEVFWSQWTLATTVSAFFFFVLPILGVMIVAAYIQFSVWEKTQSIMTDRLRRIVSDSSQDDKRTK